MGYLPAPERPSGFGVKNADSWCPCLPGVLVFCPFEPPIQIRQMGSHVEAISAEVGQSRGRHKSHASTMMNGDASPPFCPFFNRIISFLRCDVTRTVYHIQNEAAP